MMVLGKIKEFIMNDNVFTVSFLIAFIALIGSVTFYHYSELKSVERNIESAIVKGIDPVAVRCAYSSSTDVICVAYAATSSQLPITTVTKK
jgi:hypothetical protein